MNIQQIHKRLDKLTEKKRHPNHIFLDEKDAKPCDLEGCESAVIVFVDSGFKFYKNRKEFINEHTNN